MTTDKEQIRFRFAGHGLGDVCHAAAVLRLYIQAGYDVQIQPEANKRWVWQAAGIPLDTGTETVPDHPYSYPDMHRFRDLSTPDHTFSKIAHFTEFDPLPKLGTKEEVWARLCRQQIDATQAITPAANAQARRLIDGLPKPIFLLHSKGSNWQAEKSIPDGTAFQVIRELVSQTAGSVITLDWDSRSPTLDHARVRPAGRIGLDVFGALCIMCDVMIGVDSGPFHLAQWFPIATLFVSRQIPPVRCCLPNPKATYLVPATHAQHWAARGPEWHFAEFAGSEATAEEIVHAALSLETHMNTSHQPPATSHSAAGRYLYRRCGHDERPMFLDANGTIGEGAAGCEQTWALVPTAAGQALVIYGEAGRDTCHLRAMPDGIWRGHWLRAERMPIELVPIPAEIHIEHSTTDIKLDNMSRFISQAPPGIVCEVGVWKGGSLRYLAERHPDRQFFGFDTFEGMPPVTDKDNHHRQGDFSNTSLPTVQAAFEDLNHVQLVKGLFPASDTTAGQLVALAHVDVDIYESTLNCFRHFAARMATGGRIYCDDAFVTTCQGATIALTQFSAETGRVPRFDPEHHAYFQF